MFMVLIMQLNYIFRLHIILYFLCSDNLAICLKRKYLFTITWLYASIYVCIDNINDGFSA